MVTAQEQLSQLESAKAQNLNIINRPVPEATYGSGRNIPLEQAQLNIAKAQAQSNLASIETSKAQIVQFQQQQEAQQSAYNAIQKAQADFEQGYKLGQNSNIPARENYYPAVGGLTPSQIEGFKQGRYNLIQENKAEDTYQLALAKFKASQPSNPFANIPEGAIGSVKGGGFLFPEPGRYGGARPYLPEKVSDTVTVFKPVLSSQEKLNESLKFNKPDYLSPITFNEIILKQSLMPEARSNPNLINFNLPPPKDLNVEKASKEDGLGTSNRNNNWMGFSGSLYTFSTPENISQEGQKSFIGEAVGNIVKSSIKINKYGTEIGEAAIEPFISAVKGIPKVIYTSLTADRPGRRSLGEKIGIDKSLYRDNLLADSDVQSALLVGIFAEGEFIGGLAKSAVSGVGVGLGIVGAKQAIENPSIKTITQGTLGLVAAGFGIKEFSKGGSSSEINVLSKEQLAKPLIPKQIGYSDEQLLSSLQKFKSSNLMPLEVDLNKVRAEQLDTLAKKIVEAKAEEAAKAGIIIDESLKRQAFLRVRQIIEPNKEPLSIFDRLNKKVSEEIDNAKAIDLRNEALKSNRIYSDEQLLSSLQKFKSSNLMPLEVEIPKTNLPPKNLFERLDQRVLEEVKRGSSFYKDKEISFTTEAQRSKEQAMRNRLLRFKSGEEFEQPFKIVDGKIIYGNLKRIKPPSSFPEGIFQRLENESKKGVISLIKDEDLQIAAGLRNRLLRFKSGEEFKIGTKQLERVKPLTELPEGLFSRLEKKARDSSFITFTTDKDLQIAAGLRNRLLRFKSGEEFKIGTKQLERVKPLSEDATSLKRLDVALSKETKIFTLTKEGFKVTSVLKNKTPKKITTLKDISSPEDLKDVSVLQTKSGQQLLVKQEQELQKTIQGIKNKQEPLPGQLLTEEEKSILREISRQKKNLGILQEEKEIKISKSIMAEAQRDSEIPTYAGGTSKKLGAYAGTGLYEYTSSIYGINLLQNQSRQLSQSVSFTVSNPIIRSSNKHVLSSLSTSILKQAQIPLSSQKQPQQSMQLFKQGQQQLSSQREISGQTQILHFAQGQFVYHDQRQDLKLRKELKTDLDLIQEERKKKLYGNFLLEAKRKLTLIGYSVAIRRQIKPGSKKREFFTRATDLTLGEAEKLGEKIARSTLAATFRLQKTGRTIERESQTPFSVDFLRFRLPKPKSKLNAPLTFIQRSGIKEGGVKTGRLESLGERRELLALAQARRRR